MPIDPREPIEPGDNPPENDTTKPDTETTPDNTINVNTGSTNFGKSEKY